MKFAATLVSLASVATLAAASPWATPTTTATTTTTITVTAVPPTSTTSSGSCSTGPIQCCESTELASSSDGTALLALLGIVIEGIDAVLGLNCSPISVIGVGTGNACSSNVVCCDNNNVGGLISIGCVPIIL